VATHENDKKRIEPRFFESVFHRAWKGLPRNTNNLEGDDAHSDDGLPIPGSLFARVFGFAPGFGILIRQPKPPARQEAEHIEDN
jgi:hypothetical protein